MCGKTHTHREGETEKAEESVRECVQRHTERWKTEMEDESVKESA